jgi:hypothetical protein
MSTVGAVIERLYRTYLYPPDQRPPMAHLDGAIAAGASSLVLTNFSIPEDEELMAAGVVVEIDQELFQVTAYDELTLTATVKSGTQGTNEAAHADQSPVLLSPAFPRMSVYESVADNILTLYPSLFTVGIENLAAVAGGNLFAMPDPLAVEIITAWPNGHASDTAVDATMVDYHPAVGGRTVITNLGASDIWVRYRRRMGEPVDETTTLESLGVEQRWVNIIMAGAAADLFAGRDLPQAQADWIGKAFQAEVVPVGSRSQLARQLAAYRSYLMDHAQREMKAEYKANIHMRSPVKVLTRSPFG